MRRIIDFVIQKIKTVGKDSTKVVKLLQILSAFCTCKGVPVKQNQCKFQQVYMPTLDGMQVVPLFKFC